MAKCLPQSAQKSAKFSLENAYPVLRPTMGAPVYILDESISGEVVVETLVARIQRTKISTANGEGFSRATLRSTATEQENATFLAHPKDPRVAEALAKNSILRKAA